jgi:hypothetical protein
LKHNPLASHKFTETPHTLGEVDIAVGSLAFFHIELGLDLSMGIPDGPEDPLRKRGDDESLNIYNKINRNRLSMEIETEN